MKKIRMVFSVLCFATVLQAQTQLEFIIGADWINNVNRPGGNPYTMTAQDWVNIKDLGLTWGAVIYDRYDNISYANSALTGAEQNGIKLLLDRYQFQDPTQGQRWQYHSEYAQQYPPTGLTGQIVIDSVPATIFPDALIGSPNARVAKVGIHTPGYIAKGLLSPFNIDQADAYHYYVKLRMRLETGTLLTQHIPVVTVSAVRVSDGARKDTTIYADQFSGYLYQEINALDFIKRSSGSLSLISGTQSVQQPQSSAPPPNPYGPTGIAPASTQASSPTSYDYQVYWPGNITCYLDYIIVDDDYANQTFGGSYDNTIDQEVNNFKTRNGMGRYCVRDEIPGEVYGQYLTAGYTERRIKAIVVPAGYPTKTGHHYGNGYRDGSSFLGRDLAWTQNNQLDCDIYPISYTTPLPDNISYTLSFQNAIQTALINYLQMGINNANKYAVPFWFTPQVDSWGSDFREPTTLEIQQMVNLGLTYGAKGINYFLYYTVLNANGTVLANGLVDQYGAPRRTIYGGSSYAGDKWATVKAINKKLAILGPTLVNLTWQNAFSIHQGQPTGTYVTTITASNAGGSSLFFCVKT